MAPRGSLAIGNLTGTAHFPGLPHSYLPVSVILNCQRIPVQYIKPSACKQVAICVTRGRAGTVGSIHDPAFTVSIVFVTLSRKEVPDPSYFPFSRRVRRPQVASIYRMLSLSARGFSSVCRTFYATIPSVRGLLDYAVKPHKPQGGHEYQRKA